MAISTRPLRTLSDIKTHSGRVSGEHQTYRDYFQIGALELERWRRTREREAASSRIASIDERIADIDKEKAALLADATTASSVAENNDKSEAAEKKKKPSGLRIKY
ncbi:hypothetical protein PCO82_20950 [Pectobacteriaceae bacterium CE90]|nr:hypothetical protein [Prodigiosinella sp. LS101]WJV54101.1 hypothetical protein PCO85_01000 [Prodigiosinella sp. LS101]WJV58464.1 hypothetical protein PCO84_01005 [Pectobacteriaceae bacterium C111]WJY14886.1 hypothetical protein PCO82_20950 [Pectobacteriaceae bacterium CE90]